MKVGLVANARKPAARELARHAAEHLRPHCELVVAEPAEEDARPSSPRGPLAPMDVDAIVAIGGDGTFLSVARRFEVPLLAINAGTLGVLAEVDGRSVTEVDGALDRLVSGHYFVDERMKLSVRAGTAPVADAMNEVVIHCAHPARMGQFDLELDGEKLGRIQADGIILASPTGSTGYAMSALGPIVEPGVEGIVVVPIAPFRAVSRAIVIDPLHTVSVRAAQTAFPTVAVLDGQDEVAVGADEPVLVYRSPRRARFVRFSASYLMQLKGKGILPWSPVEKTDAPSGAHRADLPPHS